MNAFADQLINNLVLLMYFSDSFYLFIYLFIYLLMNVYTGYYQAVKDTIHIICHKTH